jgi:hypothetical protein
VVVVGECEDAFAGMLGADHEAVHPAGAADGHLAFGVEPVVAQPVVPLGVAVACWRGVGGRLVGLARGSSLEGAVRAPFVVVVTELVELALQLSDRPSRGSGS